MAGARRLACLALVVVMVAPAACERADAPAPAPAPPPAPSPPPAPLEPDPIQQARSEFELLPDGPVTAATWVDYSRGQFMKGQPLDAQFDEGDFIGRLRTLFGARDDNRYTLRHRASGLLITAYSGKSGPSFMCAARKAVDATLARPVDATLARPVGPSEHTPDFDALQDAARQRADAEAGPELAAVVVHLNALLDAVPPADWERTYFYDEGPGVMRVGATAGHSFATELPPPEAFAFVIAAAESKDPGARDELGFASLEADADVVMYYGEHEHELHDQRPRALAAYRRILAAANASTDDVRRATLDMAREYASKLGVKPPR